MRKFKYEVIGADSDINLNQLKAPLYVYLIINNTCNFKCKFCSRTENQQNDIRLEKFKFLIQQLKKFGVCDLYITGGEPLLHPQFDEMISYANLLNVRTSILTNGYLIEQKLEALKKANCVSVSLHGPKDVHNEMTGVNSYDKIIKNIYLIKKFTNVTVNYTVINENNDVEYMKEIANFCDSNKIPLAFSKYNDCGHGKENNCQSDLSSLMCNLSNIANQNLNFKINNCIPACLVGNKFSPYCHGCGAGQTFVCVDQQLNVKICSTASQIIGNLYKESLKKIWNSKKLRYLRKFKNSSIYCRGCKFLNFCKCGCKIEAGKKLGELNDKSVLQDIENQWNYLKTKKIKVNIAFVRREKFWFINLSKNPHRFNKGVLKVLIKLQKTGNLEEFEDSKDLIVRLYKDGLIEEVS